MEADYQESDALSEHQDNLDVAFNVLFDEVAKRGEGSPHIGVIPALTSMSN